MIVQNLNVLPKVTIQNAYVHVNIIQCSTFLCFVWINTKKNLEASNRKR